VSCALQNAPMPPNKKLKQVFEQPYALKGYSTFFGTNQEISTQRNNGMAGIKQNEI